MLLHALLQPQPSLAGRATTAPSAAARTSTWDACWNWLARFRKQPQQRISDTCRAGTATIRIRSAILPRRNATWSRHFNGRSSNWRLWHNIWGWSDGRWGGRHHIWGWCRTNWSHGWKWDRRRSGAGRRSNRRGRRTNTIGSEGTNSAGACYPVISVGQHKIIRSIEFTLKTKTLSVMLKYQKQPYPIMNTFNNLPTISRCCQRTPPQCQSCSALHHTLECRFVD
jgi:hypothetical protein